MTTKTSATIIARGTSNPAFTQLTGISVTRTGTTATYTKASHGRSNGDKLLIQLFDIEEYNGIFTISNVTTNTWDVTLKQDPGANPAGTPGIADLVTLGTAFDMSTADSGEVLINIQNGQTGPTVAPEVWEGVAVANNEVDYTWRPLFSGSTTAKELIARVITLPQGRMYVNYAVCRNTGQAVDCFAIASKAG